MKLLQCVTLAVAALSALLVPSLLARASTGADSSSAAADFPKPGLDPANIQPACKACDDFYTFATGGWQRTHPIPAGYGIWDNWYLLGEANRSVLHKILDDAAHDTASAAGSNERKIGTYYRSCMDEAAVERAGIAPLQPELGRIAAVRDRASLILETARLNLLMDVPLNFYSVADPADSTRYIAELNVGGLGLPDRDYYFRDDAKAHTIRTAFASYIATLLALGGESAAGAASDAASLIKLETAIAQATPERADLQDPLKTDHPQSVAQLAALAPDIDWPSFFAAQHAPAFTQLNVTAPDYVKSIDAVVRDTPLPVWQTYLRYHLIDAYAAALPARFVDANFAFRSTTLLGVRDQLPRWKRCAAATDDDLGEALGAVYVAREFPPSAKARALALVDSLQSVLRDDIAGLSWMSPPTKGYAQIKLAAFSKMIGYPDQFRDYAALDIADVPYAVNVERARKFATDRHLRRIGTVNDRGEWDMSPPTVDAEYNPSNNAIIFPAGILAPPFFSAETDDAVNYGAIGAVIGHEMTHGFDNAGRHYDAQGNLRDWWAPADASNFNARAQCIIDEYSQFSPAPGVNIQGKLVQGEAIADLGGITIAYKAFERTAEFRSGRKIDGYTPQQRFFLSYANVWAMNELEDAARLHALTNEHADERYRVIGTLSNMPEFWAAFGCVPGDKMVRAQACQMW